MNHPPSLRATSFYPRSGVIMHPSLGRCEYTVQEISDIPDEQVAQTIGLMSQYATEDAGSPAVQADVSRAWSSADPITDTWNYLRRGGDRGMRFVRDEVNGAAWADYEFAIPGRWRPLVELIARPRALANASDPQGDCDCFCNYGAAHLISRAVPASFVTVAADRTDPSLYTHVYLVAYPVDGPYAGQRVPLDLSHGAYPGWEVKNVFRRREWPIGSRGNLLCIGAAVLIGGAIAYHALRRAA